MDFSEEEDDRKRDGHCATHPALEAAIVCARCGDFACEECERSGDDESLLCEGCYARTWGVRRGHRDSERAMLSLGSALFLFAVLGAGYAIYSSWTASRDGFTRATLVALLVQIVAVVVTFTCARALTRLHESGFWLGLVTALLYLPGFPMGTAIGIGIGYSLIKHRAVLTREYARVYEETGGERRPKDTISQKQWLAMAVLTIIVLIFLVWITVGPQM